VLVNLSASPFHGEKGAVRRDMFRSHVRAHGLPFLYTNLVGGNDELIFDGQAYAFSGDGTLAAMGEPFTEEIVLVEVKDGTVHPLGRAAPDGDGEPEPARGVEPLPPLEALHRALVLGLSDYARKCGFRSAILGLSGGIDSALTATLAVDALGPDAVWGVTLPGRYSSEGSVTDARDLAANLGIRFDTLSIEPLYEAALGVLGPLFEGTDFGVAEENLQARARGNLLMGLSNKFGHLLLTTGNKSEMATGYCTLYGDMAGGLAVISDLPKTQVYELSRHLNREGIRIPENTLVKPPSAELRPNQKDEDSLPPYAILDDILERFLEDREGRESLIAAGHDPTVVDRVLSLVAGAEYKRRQAPPGLRVSPKAFGSGRRVPIATPWPRR
jgi:NAD+ synthetase